MTVREQFEARGEARGHAEARRTIALKLLKETNNPELVKKITGYDAEQIKNLQEETVH